MSLATLDKQEIDRFAREFEELFYRGDAATMASFYTDDARVIAPDREAVQGRAAIEEFWKAACDAAGRTAMRRTIDVQRVASSGELGYVLSQVTLEIPAGDGQVVTNVFNDVTVWRVEPDGGWRVVVDSASRTAPMRLPPTGSQPATGS